MKTGPPAGHLGAEIGYGRAIAVVIGRAAGRVVNVHALIAIATGVNAEGYRKIPGIDVSTAVAQGSPCARLRTERVCGNIPRRPGPHPLDTRIIRIIIINRGWPRDLPGGLLWISTSPRNKTHCARLCGR